MQFALNLPRDNQSICERTVDSSRQLLRENEAAQDIYEKVTSEIIREMGLAIKKQRLDSTHIFSDMAKFGRLKLLAVTVKCFLTQLKRHHESGYQSLPETLRERYAASESRLFGSGTKTRRPYEESIQEVAEDLAMLIGGFAEDENGQSARVLQNSSDPEAGYDGHKGPGYQVQISQAYDTGEEGPGLIDHRG